VAYEWDSQKAASNFRKHGVDFADAVSALEDESAITIQILKIRKSVMSLWVWTLSPGFGLSFTHGELTTFGLFQPAKQLGGSSGNMKQAYEKRIRF
jgi:hypothetical protein